MNRILRILVADDYEMAREGLRALLQSHDDLSFVGDHDGLDTAVSRALRVQPDVAVLDISLPGTAGIEMTRQLLKVVPEAKVVIHSLHADMTVVRNSIQAGAMGYVLKRSGNPELLRAIRAVAAGGFYMDPLLASRLVAASGRSDTLHQLLERPQLSEREEQVVRLIANGYSNKEVAARMNVSVKTVETYRARSMQKLGLRSRVDIVQYALRQNWLESSTS